MPSELYTQPDLLVPWSSVRHIPLGAILCDCSLDFCYFRESSLYRLFASQRCRASRRNPRH